MKKIIESFYFRAFCVLAVVFVLYSCVLISCLPWITSIDLKILHFVRTIFSWLPMSVVVAVTDFGFCSWFFPAYMFAFGYLLACRKYITIATLSGMYLFFAPAIHLVKDIFHRDRPDVLLHRVAETGYSFPSGHSTTAFYLGIIALFLVSKHVENKNLRMILMLLLAVWMLVIPFTRVWLGVHYPTDVLGGALYGSLLACFVLTIIQKEYTELK